MRFRILLAGVTAAALLPQMAAAQEAAAPAVVDSRAVYPPAFFAGANPATALDMINRLPGFSFEQGNNSVRGYGAGGNVLINGERPATKSDPLEEILRRTPAAAVERVELIYAGAQRVDMQGRSVLANVVLKSAARVERTLNLSTYVYPDTYFGPTVEYQYSKSEDINLLEWSAKVYTDRTDYTSNDVTRTRYDADGLIQRAGINLWDHIRGGNVKGSIQRGAFGGKYRINALAETEQFDRREDIHVVFPTDSWSQNREEYDAWRGELGGEFDRPLAENLTGEITLLQRLEASEYAANSEDGPNTSSFTEDATTGETIARGVLRWQQSPSLSWEGGAEGAFNFIDSQTDFTFNGVSDPADVRVEEIRGEVFGKGSWRVSEKLSLEGGLRVERSTISQTSVIGGEAGEDEKTLTYYKPRAVVVWSPTKDDQFRFRIEREVGQLNFGDFVASTSLETGTTDGRNADLEPSRSWVSEVAYERHFWGEGAVVLRYTHFEMENAVDVIPVGPPGDQFDAPGNLGEGTLDQLRINVTVPVSRFGIPGGQVRLYSSWVDSEVTDPVTGEKRRQSNQTRHVCDGRFTQDIAGGRWSWGVTVFCPTEERSWRLNEIRTWRTETQLETFVQYKPRPDLSIRVDLQNITGRTRERERIIFDGPRSTGEVLYVESRPWAFDPWLWVRVRKSF